MPNKSPFPRSMTFNAILVPLATAAAFIILLYLTYLLYKAV